MKVGIISLYHGSLNYGGNLQAYALCKYFQNQNIQAEQIQYNAATDVYSKKELLKNVGLFRFIKHYFHRICEIPREIEYKKTQSKYADEFRKVIDNRNKAFKYFKYEVVPHSSSVYNRNSIKQCNGDYDVFVSGSDQIWGMSWCLPDTNAYYLDFVTDDKIKVSYAASFTAKEIDKYQKDYLSRKLRKFDAISVREAQAIKILQELTEKEIVQTIDPTLLLKRDEWEALCEKRLVKENYCFFYFLGSNIRAKRIAKEYAKKHGLKIVEIPYAGGFFNAHNVCDENSVMEDTSPKAFLSFIKNAECVFTDSFHAVIFSYIYETQFFVFNRDAQGSMNTRIKNLLEIMELDDRFCSCFEKESLDYICAAEKINYTKSFKKVDEWREKSFDFLKRNILDVL